MTVRVLPSRVSGSIVTVPTVGALPTNAVEGAIRYVEANDTTYTYDGSAWTAIGTGGAPVVGDPNTVAGFDGSGDLGTLPGIGVSTLSGGLNINRELVYTDPSGGDLHASVLRLNPSANSPDSSWSHIRLQTNLGDNDAGYEIGSNGQAVRQISMSFDADYKSDVGSLDFITSNLDIGNGTDAIDSRGFGYAYGFGTVHSNVTLEGPIQGYGFQPNVQSGVTFTGGSYINAFYDFSNINSTLTTGYSSYAANPAISEVGPSINWTGFGAGGDIGTLSGSANALSVYTNIDNANSGSFYTGINISPTIAANARGAIGVSVTMDNVATYAGAVSAVTVQDLTFTFVSPGDNNNYTIEFANTATAGAETVTITGTDITVGIQSGVSTATQVKAACDASPQFVAAVGTTISGVASDPQVTAAPANFTGGINPGYKQAAYFDGNVQIDGSLAFSGALSVGQFNAYYATNPVNGSGNPLGMHGLVTGMTALDSTTRTNADAIGVNTAMLVTLEADSNTTSGPFGLGFASLALPCVAETHTNSYLDYMTCAAYALNLSMASTGGTIDNVRLCRTVAIPNGVTTINRLYGYHTHLPFGSAAVAEWGLYSEDAVNYMELGLKLGGTAGTDDRPDSGQLLHVEGSSKFEGAITHSVGNVGFFGQTPTSQPTSSGAATAGGSYGATEQTMLQQVYDALRQLGLMS